MTIPVICGSRRQGWTRDRQDGSQVSVGSKVGRVVFCTPHRVGEGCQNSYRARERQCEKGQGKEGGKEAGSSAQSW